MWTVHLQNPSIHLICRIQEILFSVHQLSWHSNYSPAFVLRLSKIRYLISPRDYFNNPLVALPEYASKVHLSFVLFCLSDVKQSSWNGGRWGEQHDTTKTNIQKNLYLQVGTLFNGEKLYLRTFDWMQYIPSSKGWVKV